MNGASLEDQGEGEEVSRAAEDHNYMSCNAFDQLGKTESISSLSDHSYCAAKPDRKHHTKVKQDRLDKNNHAVNIMQSILEKKTNDLKCIEEIGEIPLQMKNRKKGFVSVLMKKGPTDLENLHLFDVIQEFSELFPGLMHMLLKIMLPTKATRQDMADVVPRLSLIYSVALQSRVKELSRLQRGIAVMLADNVCDQAVYDRLNRFGISSSYCVAIDTISSMGKLYPEIITKAANTGKYIRFIGDNLNITVGTSHETINSHKHMEHMFTSTCLVYEHKFLDKPTEPEIDIDALSIKNILLSKEEYKHVKTDVTNIITKTISKYNPQLSSLKNHIPKTDIPKTDFNDNTATEIIPLPCLPYNEQKYQDDIKILEWYQSLCEKIVNRSTLDIHTQFQIGGDQLTRERFSEALLLRLDNIDPHDRFANIGRVTAEFFHLSMNLLEKGVFGELWSVDGDVEVGTLRGECERLSRKNVDPNVMKAYEDDKRFAINYADALVIEAALDYFEMENINSQPKTTPTSGNTTEWIEEHIGNIVDDYIFPGWSKEKPKKHLTEETEGLHETLRVNLADGSVYHIPLGRGRKVLARSPQPDGVKDYMHLCLEILIIFKYLQALLKMPDRNRLLGLLKMILIVLKGHSNKAKYPREILRMLVQQYSVMGLKEACMVFQACFVNLKGKIDTHVPADLVQEWNVRESKLQIKHMFSNKTERNIISKTAALPLVHSIASNMDQEIGTIIRSKRHKEKNSDDDEMLMMTDFHNIKPFQHKEGRFFKGFKNVKKTMLDRVDGFHLRQWFEKSKNIFSTH